MYYYTTHEYVIVHNYLFQYFQQYVISDLLLINLYISVIAIATNQLQCYFDRCLMNDNLTIITSNEY